MSTQPSSQPSGPYQFKLMADSLEKPSLDDRLYRILLLLNGLEVMLIHDSETETASASLDVDVGYFSDEPDMPGMAHAVEHLLFMGTKTYAAENDYLQYLSTHSGEANAYTDCTHTNYYFQVAATNLDDDRPSTINPSPFLGALTRFSKFFIEPLFLASSVDRELKAVDSEHQKNLRLDLWRLQNLKKSLSNPNHPYSYFATGNFEVLKTIPEARGVNVREKFIDFYDRHYSANRMKLVVLGREPIDVLQAWTLRLFSDVPNKNLPQNRWASELPFRQSELGLMVFVKPVMDIRQVNISFPWPEESDLHDRAPSLYVCDAIGHEGPGSILKLLKDYGWATALSAGASPICPGSPGTFDCEIHLTEEGLKRYQDVVKIVFEYISMLQQMGPQKRLHQESKTMCNLRFEYRSKEAPVEYTRKLSAVMQIPSLPREKILRGSHWIEVLDSCAIAQCLNQLTPDNCQIFVVSQTFPGDWNEKEKWYGTEHRAQKIPPHFMEELRKLASVPAAKLREELHLPHKNEFIPVNFAIKPTEVRMSPLRPLLVKKTNMVMTWWKKDDTYNEPRATVKISCSSPLPGESVENFVQARLYSDLVIDALESYSYAADLAGIRYDIAASMTGLHIEIEGFDDKLMVLLEQVLKTARDLKVEESRFSIIKDRLLRQYKNSEFRLPYYQIGERAEWLLLERSYNYEQRRQALARIHLGDFMKFWPQIFSKYFLCVYVIGNIVRDEALRLTEMIESTLKPPSLPWSQRPLRRWRMLSAGSNYVFQQLLQDPKNTNNGIQVRLAVGDGSEPVKRAKTSLLLEMICEPFYDQLRTKEQLGYIVCSHADRAATTVGINFFIQSAQMPELLDARIESFIRGYTSTLEGMDEGDFEEYKRSVIVTLLMKPKTLAEETERYWSQISNGYYDFESGRTRASHIEPLSKSDMIDFWNQYIRMGAKHRAKLSTMLIAQCHPDSDVDVKESLGGLSLQQDQHLAPQPANKEGAAYTPFVNEHEAGPRPVLITDLEDFWKAQTVFNEPPMPIKPLSEYEYPEFKL